VKSSKCFDRIFNQTVNALIIILLFANCSEQKSEDENLKSFREQEIPQTINLTGEKHFFEEIKNPLKIFIKNNKLIIGESRRIYEELPPIHILDAKSMEYLTPKGKLGFGPGEVSDVSGIDLGHNENTFWVYSAMEKQKSKRGKKVKLQQIYMCLILTEI
jgi:hypothetical protein